MKDITRQWLDYAKTDIIVAKKCLADEFLTNMVAFHSQQTVEKCFKAIIEEHSFKLLRVHSLYRLYEIIKDKIFFDIDVQQLEKLDEVYTISRYPSDVGLLPDGKPTLLQAKNMYEFANEIYLKTVEILENING